MYSLSSVSSQKGFTQRCFSYINTFIRGAYYLSIWLYIQILILVFMLPFMKVSKPMQENHTSKSQTFTTKENTSRNFLSSFVYPLKNIISISTKYLLSKLQ
jgi:hypothetical protein